jgi:hypothetical protein
MRRAGRITAAAVAAIVLVLAALAVLVADRTGADDTADAPSTPDPTSASTEPDSTDPGTADGSPTGEAGATEEPEPTDDPAPRTFTVAMSGDVLLHSGTWDTAEADAARAGRTGLDFGPMFAGVRSAVSAADLAICHLETPLAAPQGPFASYPVFDAPPQVVPALLDTGYDVCSTASNHSVDQGGDGLVRTLRTLDRAGMPHFGTALSRRASQRPTILDVAGVRVGLLNYTYGTNGIPVPPDMPWSVPLIDPDRIRSDAAEAKRDGAEVVIVALHFGTEYSTAPDSYQVDVVDQITRSPNIDLVYGHHAHVPEPFDKVHGTWVAYGLGNFIAQQLTSMPDTYRGITSRFELTERPSGDFAVTDVAYLPTMITPYVAGDPRMRVLDAAGALHDPSTADSLRPDLRATVTAVTAAAELLGADRHGLHLWRTWRD